MWRALSTVCVLLLATTDARASLPCSTAKFDHHALPLGCPIALYEIETFGPDPAVVVARRNGVDVVVSKSLVVEMTTLEAKRFDFTCEGHETRVEHYTTSAKVYRFELTDEVMVGDVLYAKPAEGYESSVVTAAGPCTPEVPLFSCGRPAENCPIPPPPPDPDPDAEREDAGCSSTNAGGSWWVAFVVLGLIPRRRLR